MEGQGLQKEVTVDDVLTEVANVCGVSQERREEIIAGWKEGLGEFASQNVKVLHTLIKNKSRWDKIAISEDVKALLEIAFEPGM